MKRPRLVGANDQQVYRALHSAGTSMTAYEVLDAVRLHGISAPQTVYRALNRLVEEGLVHRLESINAYVVCTHPHHQHASAVFAICRGCGAIVELPDAKVVEHLNAQAAERGFEVIETTIELRGRCAGCRRADGDQRDSRQRRRDTIETES
jgi:Fur family zinc uptake transcriptional regulator